jgi:hypothetical protein
VLVGTTVEVLNTWTWVTGVRVLVRVAVAVLATFAPAVLV